MDYTKLAEEFFRKMHLLQKSRLRKKITESVQGEVFLLYYLFHRDDDVVPGEISNIMGVSSARIAAALNSLEDKGFITRDIDKSDRRRILVRLTPEGRQLAQKRQQEVIQDTAEMLRLLGDDDALEYVRITGKLAELGENRRNDRK